MILLISPIQRSQECAVAIEESTREPVAVAKNLLEATTLLRAEAYKLVIFDHHLVEAEPNETDIALAHLADAVSLEINFALTGIERLVSEVKAALRRQSREHAIARAVALAELRGELSNTLTALLTEFDAARECPDLSADADKRFRSAQALAEELRHQLEAAVANN